MCYGCGSDGVIVEELILSRTHPIIFHGELQLYKYQERLETENEENRRFCERYSLLCITVRLWRVGLGKKQFIAGSSLTHKELLISW